MSNHKALLDQFYCIYYVNSSRLSHFQSLISGNSKAPLVSILLGLRSATFMFEHVFMYVEHKLHNSFYMDLSICTICLILCSIIHVFVFYEDIYDRNTYFDQHSTFCIINCYTDNFIYV